MLFFSVEGLDEIENELLKCEACGKMGYASKFLRSKRFCSLSCAKRYSALLKIFIIMMRHTEVNKHDLIPTVCLGMKNK